MQQTIQPKPPSITNTAIDETTQSGPLISPQEALIALGVTTHKQLTQAERSPSCRNFEWRNLATINTPISTMEQVLQALSPQVIAPRTAHLGGTWEWIARGGGGSVAFNRILIEDGIAQPFLFDLNQVPTRDGKGGDTLYYPGVIRSNDNGTPVYLDLYTYDNETKTFVPWDERNPIFAPFAHAMNNGSYTPIQTIHRTINRTLELPQCGCYVSDYLLKNWGLVTTITRAILGRISLDEDPNFRDRNMKKIFHKVINTNGTVASPNIRINQDEVTVGYDRTTMSIDQLLINMASVMQVATGVKTMQQHAQEYTQSVYFSNDYLIFLLAVLNADKPHGNTTPEDFYNTHFHWGALQMAGAPPRIKPYFPTSTGPMRDFLTWLSAAERIDYRGQILGLPKLKPIHYVLLPAGIYNLYPHQCYPQEQLAIEGLIASVLKNAKHLRRNVNKHINAVETAVENWLVNMQEGILSAPFIARFSPHDTTINQHLPHHPELARPSNFGELTTKEASLIVGYLTDKGERLP